MMEEEQLETEIDQSDRIQEKITLALVSLDENLEAITTPAEGLSGHHVESHSPSPGPREEVHLATLRSSVSTSVSHATSMTTNTVIATMLDASPYTATASSSISTFLTSSAPTGLLPTSVALPLTTSLSWPSMTFTSASGLSSATFDSPLYSFGPTSLSSGAHLVYRYHLSHLVYHPYHPSHSVLHLPCYWNPSSPRSCHLISSLLSVGR